MKISLIVALLLFTGVNVFSQNNSRSGKTTLDSLQGTWRLKNDRNNELKIMHDTVLTVYSNKMMDAAMLYISNAYIDSTVIRTRKFHKSKDAGRFLTLLSGTFKYYEIKSLSANELILANNGKILTYVKEE